MLKRVAALTAGTAGAVLLTASASWADPDPVEVGDCGNQSICWEVTDPGKPAKGGTPGNEGAAPQPAGNGKKRTCQARGITVPCSNPDFGEFSNGCYYRLAEPQPPASDPVWGSHEPGEGAIYDETCIGAQGAVTSQGWRQDAPAGAGGAGPTPAELAQQALAQMTLLGPDIGIAPKPDGKGVVGMPVWMWANDTPNRWGPVTASASAGAVTVNATAQVTKIEWQMGDGTKITCNGGGTPYKRAYGKRESPSCGHRYTDPSSVTDSGKYHVTATATWDIDWEGGGETGQLTEVRNSSVDITVAEVQVLN